MPGPCRGSWRPRWRPPRRRPADEDRSPQSGNGSGTWKERKKEEESRENVAKSRIKRQRQGVGLGTKKKGKNGVMGREKKCGNLASMFAMPRQDCFCKNHTSFKFLKGHVMPNHQRWWAKWKLSWNIQYTVPNTYTQCVHVLARLTSVCMLSWRS